MDLTKKVIEFTPEKFYEIDSLMYVLRLFSLDRDNFLIIFNVISKKVFISEVFISKVLISIFVVSFLRN